MDRQLRGVRKCTRVGILHQLKETLHLRLGKHS